jgi:hypothetical protein
MVLLKILPGGMNMTLSSQSCVTDHEVCGNFHYPLLSGFYIVRNLGYMRATAPFPEQTAWNVTVQLPKI